LFYQEGWKINNSAIGSSFESFLEEDIKEDVETNAVKSVIALQMQESLNREYLSKTELAARLETSRAAIDRLLDPYNESITLLTLKKAAAIMGKKIKLELV
jgi:predicted XRE-type DNA-binding protein